MQERSRCFFHNFLFKLFQKSQRKYLQISHIYVIVTSINVFDAGVAFAVWVVQNDFDLSNRWGPNDPPSTVVVVVVVVTVVVVIIIINVFVAAISIVAFVSVFAAASIIIIVIVVIVVVAVIVVAVVVIIVIIVIIVVVVVIVRSYTSRQMYTMSFNSPSFGRFRVTN